MALVVSNSTVSFGFVLVFSTKLAVVSSTKRDNSSGNI